MASSAQDNDEDIISSINITPLVDIFLVLLIIFMITSSVIDQRQIALTLPKAAHAGSEAPKASGLVLDRNRQLYLDGQPTDSATVIAALRQAVAEQADHQVLISADEDLPYKEVVTLLDLVRGAGVTKYALKVMRSSP
jgi:biopolymer transport protein TolR